MNKLTPRHAQLEQFFTASLELLCMVGPEGKFTLLNPRWEVVLGYSRDELMAVPFINWVHPDDRAATVAATERIVAGKDTVDFESRYLARNGEYRWLHWSCRATTPSRSFIGVVRDVTSLRRELDMYKLAIECAPTGVVVVDAAGRITLVNQQVEDMFGYARSELLGQPLALLVPKEARASQGHWRTRLEPGSSRRLLSAGQDPFGVRKDGTELPLEIGLNQLVTPEGTYVLATMVNITERRQRELEIQESLDELERHRNEMTALGELSSLLQHAEVPGEPQAIVATFADQLFSGVAGAVYLYPPLGRDLELAAPIGNYQGAARLGSADCWALRRGQTHLSSIARRPACAHAQDPEAIQLCVPMAAHGHSLGMITFAIPVSASTKRLESLESLAKAVADQLALAITNLELRERLRRLSIRDPLTDLYNRRYLEEAIEQELARARRHCTEVGVLVIDIDHFKRFNDENGHRAGDAALKELATWLSVLARAEDTMCRYGGEEFVVILPGASLNDAATWAERARLLVQQRSNGRITVSIGVAAFPEVAQSWEALFAHADTALYAAKSAGRNRVMRPPSAADLSLRGDSHAAPPTDH